MELLFLLWPIVGAAIHIKCACVMKTWCGKPIWHEPMTYFMFLPAMTAGPILLLFADVRRELNE